MTLVYTSKCGPSGVVLELNSGGVARGATIEELTTNDVANESTVTGDTLTEALDNATAPASGSTPGYKSLTVYANAASARIGTTFCGAVVQAAFTWTDPSHIPPGALLMVDVAAPGAGGASGPIHTNTVGGGSAAGSGARWRHIFSRQELIDALPIAMVCDLGAAPGAAQTLTGVLTSPGILGGDAGVCAFGDLMLVFGGSGGAIATVGSNRTGGAGGGRQSAGTPASGAALSASATGGGYGGTTGIPLDSDSGAGCVTAVNGRPASWGGASGAGSPGSTNVAGLAGGRSRFGGGGGGAGGGAATGAASAGGQGGKSGGNGPIGISQGGGGLPGTAEGGHGQDGADGDLTHNGDGGGGGGGKSGSGSSGRGGNGGFPGGAGAGAGGAARTTGTMSSDRGGFGADSAIIIQGM